MEYNKCKNELWYNSATDRLKDRLSKPILLNSSDLDMDSHLESCVVPFNNRPKGKTIQNLNLKIKKEFRTHQ